MPLSTTYESGLAMYDTNLSFRANMHAFWESSRMGSEMTFIPPDCSNFTGQLRQTVYENHSIDHSAIQSLHAYLSASTPKNRSLFLLNGDIVNLDDNLMVECDNTLLSATKAMVDARNGQHCFQKLTVPLV